MGGSLGVAILGAAVYSTTFATGPRISAIGTAALLGVTVMIVAVTGREKRERGASKNAVPGPVQAVSGAARSTVDSDVQWRLHTLTGAA